MMKHKNTLIIAKRLLSEAFEQSIDLRLKDIVVDYRGVANTILRGEVIAPSENVPATVIVKHSNRQKGHLYREWAALEFLNGLPDVQEMVPDLYGGDREAELLVMEDLGERSVRLLGKIVEGNDAQKAEEALMAFQRALGRLHALTVGEVKPISRFVSVIRRRVYRDIAFIAFWKG